MFPAARGAERVDEPDRLAAAPDRKTHELIRLVCLVILRNHRGTSRVAQLAREVGATWEEVLRAIMLRVPGLRRAARRRGDPARAGFDIAPEVEDDDDE